jgi:hypothetical protein
VARYRVDVPPSGLPVQAIAPWPVYGLRIANQTDVEATVTDDAGRSYTARPGGIWAGDTPATVTFTSQLSGTPSRGECQVWLYDRPGEAQSEGGSSGAPLPGSGDAGEWDRVVAVNRIGTGGWIPFVGGGGGDPNFLPRTLYSVPVGYRAHFGPAWILVRRVGVTPTVSDRFANITVATEGVQKQLLYLPIPAAYRTIGAAQLWAGAADLGYYGEGATFDCGAGILPVVPDTNLNLWIEGVVHVLAAAA